MDRLLDFSADFVLSGGTVPVDISKRLVLLLYFRPKSEYVLPKGRKNVGESLEAAAVRETTEESGFRCHLFKHQLHTNAQELKDSHHAEPIAVQQRMNQGVRKIIFWYISEVDSDSERMMDTQEEGEDFDVAWVPMAEAPSKCSFIDDRKILEKALEAISPQPLASAMPIHEVRDTYLDAAVDRQALGFLSISLGGGIVKQHVGTIQSKILSKRDWDGFGILETKDSIVRLVRDFRAELCAMLRIEKEECPSMEVPEDLGSGKAWDILRFSGWTAEGSKRTITLWSKECFERVVSMSTSSQLGVLSYKVKRFIECSDPEHGPRLHICQPIFVSKYLHILCDSEFLQGPALEASKSSDTAGPQSFSPGVSYDLFLTSMCIFERKSGFTAAVKAALLRKWLLLLGASDPLSIIPYLYRAEAISSTYTSKLRAEILAMNIKVLDICSIPEFSFVPKTQETDDAKGYRNIIVSPLRPPERTASVINNPPQPANDSYPTVIAVHYDPKGAIQTPFALNSVGRYADIWRDGDKTWQQVYSKHSITVLHEVRVIAQVRQYFPLETIQTILAVDEGGTNAFFKRYRGETLNEIRLRYHHGHGPFSGQSGQLQRRTEEWFIDLELRRASDVLTAYQKSFKYIPSDNCSDQAIHKLYHGRLLRDHRFRHFYGESNPDFLKETSNGCISLQEFWNHSININGKSHGTLQHHFDRALRLLDPRSPAGLQSLPYVFGFGDGHGGNVMVSSTRDSPHLLYIDYEVTGFHTPFLDLVKSIYMDGFFSAVYADLLFEHLPCKKDNEPIWVEWSWENSQINIDYGFELEPLWKALASIKLEYTLRPVFEWLEELAPSQRRTAEETLAYGLFSCAVLTRNFSKRSDVFYLNMALGIRLAMGIKDVFAECFGWNNWPHSALFN